ncbi:matrixin family metalloprotease [Oligoflexus tunisiensis]|uniref:matrixin family metalloprotease n=1 Tax=Oligoflexus tunisiensis TaxID=708132 RepID=UPI00114D0EC3|nr:matrixin family metalloprotease [Oligoflexus tunisiensis]
MRNARPINRFWFFTLLFILPACGTPKEEKDTNQGPVRISWPDRDQQGLADADLQPFEMNEKSFIGSGRFNSVFWLDFEGATVSSRESFIVANAGLNQVVIPPFMPADIGSNENRESLKLSLVQSLIPLFPDVDIRLTTTQPVAAVYNRVHIGGSNFTGRPRVVGIAPLDLGNRAGDDILFIYSRDLREPGDAAASRTKLVHVIAHEIAHSLGARHIDNNRALMKTSVALEADSFNQTGPVVNAPQEIENSLQVLLNTAGSRSAQFAEKALPSIVDLGAIAKGGVIQYTVITRNNFVANPGINLNGFHYFWNFEGQRTEGTSVLMTFDDKDDHLLELTVQDDEGQSRTFNFSVGRRR